MLEPNICGEVIAHIPGIHEIQDYPKISSYKKVVLNPVSEITSLYVPIPIPFYIRHLYDIFFIVCVVLFFVCMTTLSRLGHTYYFEL